MRIKGVLRWGHQSTNGYESPMQETWIRPLVREDPTDQGAAWMGAEFGGEWIHVYVWLSPFALHLNVASRLYSNIK